MTRPLCCAAAACIAAEQLANSPQGDRPLIPSLQRHLYALCRISVTIVAADSLLPAPLERSQHPGTGRPTHFILRVRQSLRQNRLLPLDQTVDIIHGDMDSHQPRVLLLRLALQRSH